MPFVLVETLGGVRNRLVCDVCKLEIWTEADPENTFHQCLGRPATWKPPAKAAPGDLSCVHRGGETRRARCPSCKGHVELKIFACAKHGECALSDKPLGVHYCGDCSDLEPPAPAPPATHQRLDFRHGLGDAVQFTAVLRHLRAAGVERIELDCFDGQQQLFGGDLADVVEPIAADDRHRGVKPGFTLGDLAAAGAVEPRAPLDQGRAQLA